MTRVWWKYTRQFNVVYSGNCSNLRDPHACLLGCFETYVYTYIQPGTYNERAACWTPDNGESLIARERRTEESLRVQVHIVLKSTRERERERNRQKYRRHDSIYMLNIFTQNHFFIFFYFLLKDLRVST